MDVDAAIGRIIGMVMAYAVSFLGLLLAYYNHRKRSGTAPAGPAAPRPGAEPAPIASRRHEEAPGTRSLLLRPWPWVVLGLVATALVLLAAIASSDEPDAARALLAQLPGILVPGAVFALSFWLTWALYRRFAGSGR
jgi:hypothetical protein